MHVIVGQGQLDAVLSRHARRTAAAFIEEAAGVLKHRKRKEKALRKLDAMQANLTRLTDLTAELRRQLKPLGRQAEVARRAAGVQADLRDARLRLLADDLRHAARRPWTREVADETAAARAPRRGRGRARRGAARARPTLEAALAADAPRLAARPGDLVPAVRARRSGFRGTATLAAERHRHLAAAARARRGPAATRSELDAEADRVREQEAELRRARWRPTQAGWPSAVAPRSRASRRALADGRAGAGRRGPRRSPTGARGWPG